MSARNSWLRCRIPRPSAEVRVVCLPHAGGAASFFGPWAALASEDIELVSVQYPGREDRLAEPFPAGPAWLAWDVAAALAVKDDRPIVLFGHSLGAVLAYEVARVLEFRYSRQPLRLIVSGRRAPSDSPGGAVHLLPDDAVVDELIRLGGPNGILSSSPEVRSVFLPAIRADFRLAETYRYVPGDEVSCPITAVIGSEDTEVDAGQAGLWAKHTTGSFELQVLPGGHFYLLDHAEAVLKLLERAENSDL